MEISYAKNQVIIQTKTGEKQSVTIQQLENLKKSQFKIIESAKLAIAEFDKHIEMIHNTK
jgi:hypothetical protein